MLRRVTIRGFGPHPDTILDFGAITDVIGASESGKTTLLEAVCWVVTGRGPDGRPVGADAVRTGAKRAEVIVELVSGTGLRRTLSPTGSVGRQILRDGGKAQITSESAWATALGALGRDLEVVRYVMAPLAWVELAEGPGGGRPLRDLLDRVLPGGDRLAALAELFPELADDDPDTEKEAIEVRRDANRARDEARGAHQAAARQVEQLRAAAPVVPSGKDVDAARAVIAAADGWKGHIDATAAQRAHDEWHARLRELGDRPKVDGEPPTEEELEAASSARRDAVDAFAAASKDLDRIEGQAVDTHPDVIRAAAKVPEDHGGSCPTCGADWPNAAKAHKDAAAAHKKVVADVTKRREAALKKARTAFGAAEQALSAAEARCKALAAAAAATDWDRSRAQLGDCPPAPALVPPAPGTAQPRAGEVVAARELLEGLRDAEQRAAQHREVVTAAKAEAEAAKATAQERADAAARADRLVEAVRRVPSVLLAGKLQAFNAAMDGVALDLDGDGIVVLVDGRPWRRASAGRMRVADLQFRLALRAAVGPHFVPIFVDQAQDWSGDWPSVAPMVFLWTRAGELRAAARGERGAHGARGAA